MNVYIIHAHPEPQSFNGAMTRHAQQVLSAAGHEVRVHDLYARNWNPVSDRRNFVAPRDPAYFKQQIEEMHASETGGFAPDIAAELETLDWCDALIFQFPLWWFGLPAILKGWVDRVFVMGRVYGGGKWYDRGTFRGKRAMCAVTTGGGPTMYAADGLNGELDAILFPINHGIFAFTGFSVLPSFVVWGPARATDAERRAYLDAYAGRLRALATTPPIAYPGLDAFDPQTFRRKPA